MTLLLGIDIGFGSLKSTLVDATDGAVVATAAKELRTSAPQPGWSEQDPEYWFAAFVETVATVLRASAVNPATIAALSFSAGAHTPVLLDENDRVLRPAILWNDQRSGEEAATLNEHHGPMLLATGFQKAAATWTLPQLLWLQRHEPGVTARTRRLLVAKDYLRFRATGRAATDVVDAAGTLLFDPHTGQWSPDLCATIGWPVETLPPILRPEAIAGEVLPDVADATGLRRGTPVVTGASDTAVEAFGAGAINPGDGVIKLATAATTSVMTHEPVPDRRVITYPQVVPGLWYQITATNSCASAHRWLRDLVFGEDAGGDAFAAMDDLASKAPPGCDGLLFHPYLNGERSPYWDPKLRADFVGLTLRHGREHLSRALYEGIAFSLKDCLTELEAVGLRMTSARIVGGGAQSSLWRQVVSDVLGVEVLKTAVDDASYGAALLAGVGIGAFRDHTEAVERCVRVTETHRPDAETGRRYAEMFEIYREAQRALVGVNHRLGDGPG